jgi:DNA end-binding protein Ku
MAEMFVGAFDQGFDPDQFHDRYREALRELVDAKIAGHEIVQPADSPADSNVIDLMEALRASVAQAEAGGASDETSAEHAETQAKTTAKKATQKTTAKKAPAKKAPAKKTAKKSKSA